MVCSPGQWSSLQVTGEAQPVGSNPYHQYNLYEYPCGNPGAATLVEVQGAFPHSYTTPISFTTLLDPTKCYYVKHGLWNDCTPWMESRIYDIRGSVPLSVTIDAHTASCGVVSPQLTAVPNGTAPFVYDWNSGSGSSETYPYSGPGTYSVTVTDMNGCMASASVTLSDNLSGGYGGIDFDQLVKRHARLNGVSTPDRYGLAYFGNSVSVHNDFAIAGAYQQELDANGNNLLEQAGAAYVFEKDNGAWNQAGKLVPDLRYGMDHFGYAVSVSGSLAVVGAPLHDHGLDGSPVVENGGAAYVFERDGSGEWHEIAKLLPSTASPNHPNDWHIGDNFGTSVAISGNLIVVGAPLQDFGSAGSGYVASAGAVYVFDRNEGGIDNWGQVKKITAPSRQYNAQFGKSVAITSAQLIVGAPHESSKQGAAYVFGLNGGAWTLDKKLTASDGTLNDLFGWSVAISGENAVVGAKEEDAGTGLNRAGSAYVFNQDYPSADNWGEVQKLVALDKASEDHFGVSVSISGNYILAGAFLEDEDENGSNTQSGAGSAYVFELNGGSWTEVQKIVSSDRSANDNFGNAVSISGGNILIGADLEDHDEAGSNYVNNAGSVYFYEGGCLCDMNITTWANTICEGFSNGFATVNSITGGEGPYSYLWSNGGTSATIAGLTAGTYTVTVTDANGCTANGAATVLSIVCQRGEGGPFASEQAGSGETPTEEAMELRVYPNPTSGLLTLDWGGENAQAPAIGSVSILDLTGKVVKTTSLDTNVLDVTELPSGVYFLQAKTEVGTQHIRFVKH